MDRPVVCITSAPPLLAFDLGHPCAAVFDASDNQQEIEWTIHVAQHDLGGLQGPCRR
jgi:hypothetical protein